jgi:hypothetical protein
VLLLAAAPPHPKGHIVIDETTTPDNLAEAVERYPLRSYEVTFTDGRRQRIFATVVRMPRSDFMSRGTGVVEFYGPIDATSHLGRAGRLILAAQFGTVIAAVRDSDIEITDIDPIGAPVQHTFGRRLLDALTFTRHEQES